MKEKKKPTAEIFLILTLVEMQAVKTAHNI